MKRNEAKSIPFPGTLAFATTPGYGTPYPKKDYFVEFTFDTWEVLYTIDGVREGNSLKVFHTGVSSNESREIAEGYALRMAEEEVR